MTTIIKWLNNPYSLGFLLCAAVIADLISWGFVADLNKSEWASWVQGIGTIAAIAGTFLAADRQVTQQRRHAAVLIRQIFYPTAAALDALALMYGPPSRPDRGNEEDEDEPDAFSVEGWREIAQLAQVVLENHQQFKDRIHRYEAVLNLLSAESMRTALALESQLEDGICGVVTRLSTPPQDYDFETSTVRFLEASPTWSSRLELAAFNRRVREYMAKLKREAS
jgi:hypothetical protein